MHPKAAGNDCGKPVVRNDALGRVYMALDYFDAVWEEYCMQCGVEVDGKWLENVKKYEQDVLLKR